MTLESFYGGKPGISPVIRERFKYINTEDPAYKQILNQETILTEEEAQYLKDVGIETEWTADKPTTITWTADKLAPFTMDECFKNPKYTNVWYSEFCIIDTDNKENPNNGKLYRRTLKRMNSKKANDSIYAEYMGQIVGPRGSTPNFYISSIEDAKEKATNFNEDNSIDQSRDYTYLKETKDDHENTIYKITYTDPESLDDIAIIGNSGNIVTVPGKEKDDDDNDIYHDNIRYTWCNVRQDSEDGKSKESWVYLGFEIPYTVLEIDFKRVRYYEDPAFSEDDGNDNHPFYKKYNLQIPYGTPGVSIQNIFIVRKDEERPKYGEDNEYLHPIYDKNNFQIIYNPDSNFFEFSGTRKVEEKNNGEKASWREEAYWVAKIVLRNYTIQLKDDGTGTTRYPSIESYYIYLGPYREIDTIERIGHDLKITYTAADGEEDKVVTLKKVFPREATNLIKNNENKIFIQYDDKTIEEETDIKLPTDYISKIARKPDETGNKYTLQIWKNDKDPQSQSPDENIEIPLLDINNLSVPEIKSKTPNPNGDDIEKNWDILQINILEDKTPTSPWNPTNSPWIL